MQDDDYTLTADEQAMIGATVEFYQAQANQEIATLLRSIVRSRKLDPNANWSLQDGKLRRPRPQEVLPEAIKPAPASLRRKA